MKKFFHAEFDGDKFSFDTNLKFAQLVPLLFTYFEGITDDDNIKRIGIAAGIRACLEEYESKIEGDELGEKYS